MPCYGPLTAYRSADVNPETGLRPLVFRKDESHSGIAMQIPCGQCIGCKLERSRQWALRCIHEMKSHTESAFLTLTYDEKWLPAHGSLKKRHLQLFMKRLRKRRPTGLRFYACGEYGEIGGRPHYHVLLLNTSFSDMKKRSWGSQTSQHETYASAEAFQLWPFGQNVIGRVTFESCAYVARYCTKVLTGVAREEYGDKEPEFAVMSRRPGIGMDWFNSYSGEWYKHDSVIVDGREASLTRFYDSKFELSVDAVEEGRLFNKFERLKIARRRKAVANKADNSIRRLIVKEKLALATLKHFKKGEL